MKNRMPLISGDRPAGADLMQMVVLCAVLIGYGITFALDIWGGARISVGILYILLVYCGLWFRGISMPFLLAGIGTVLLWVSMWQAGETPANIVINRLLGTMALWVVAWVVYTFKRTRRQLETSRDELKATLMNAFGAIITIDPKGTILLFNPMAERIFGYAAADVIGRNVNMLMPEPHRSAHDNYLEHYNRTGEAKIIGKGRSVMARRKDGSEFPVDLGVSKAHNNGKPIFIGLIHDITARREAEIAVMERTAELERSNRELDDFAYIASHDLKEPLRGIHNYASFLMEDYAAHLDEGGRDKLKTLIVLSQRLEGLINALLYYSRVGRADLNRAQTDLNTVVEDVLFSLKPVIEERNVVIRLPKPLPRAYCDGIQIGEVFRNLITNAMKYNDKDDRWIEVGCTEEPGAAVTFYVRDNGIGIAQKHQDAVFRIFKRLNTRDRFGEGTGLGLTIAQKIVERHGGAIWLESQPREGTTFFFTLGKA